MQEIHDGEGFIFLHRKLLHSRVWVNEGLLKVWVWCLLRANHSSRWAVIAAGRGETEIYIKRGQFIFGRKTAARELGMKESTVWDRIRKLAKMGNVNVKSNSSFSMIEVCNYEQYQSGEPGLKAGFTDKPQIPTAVRERKRLKNQLVEHGRADDSDNGPTAVRQPSDTDNNVDNVNNKNTSPRPNGWGLVPVDLVRPMESVCRQLASSRFGPPLFPEAYKFVGLALKGNKRPDAIYDVLKTISHVRPANAWAYGSTALEMENQKRNADEFEAAHKKLKSEKPASNRKRPVPAGVKRIPVA